MKFIGSSVCFSWFYWKNRGRNCFFSGLCNARRHWTTAVRCLQPLWIVSSWKMTMESRRIASWTTFSIDSNNSNLIQLNSLAWKRSFSSVSVSAAVRRENTNLRLFLCAQILEHWENQKWWRTYKIKHKSPWPNSHRFTIQRSRRGRQTNLVFSRTRRRTSLCSVSVDSFWPCRCYATCRRCWSRRRTSPARSVQHPCPNYLPTCSRINPVQNELHETEQKKTKYEWLLFCSSFNCPSSSLFSSINHMHAMHIINIIQKKRTLFRCLHEHVWWCVLNDSERERNRGRRGIRRWNQTSKSEIESWIRWCTCNA